VLLDNTLWFEQCSPASAVAPGQAIEDIEKEPKKQEWKYFRNIEAAASGAWEKVDIIASGKELSIISRSQRQGIYRLIAR
jgi:hypothetical protein